MNQSLRFLKFLGFCAGFFLSVCEINSAESPEKLDSSRPDKSLSTAPTDTMPKVIAEISQAEFNANIAQHLQNMLELKTKVYQRPDSLLSNFHPSEVIFTFINSDGFSKLTPDSQDKIIQLMFHTTQEPRAPKHVRALALAHIGGVNDLAVTMGFAPFCMGNVKKARAGLKEMYEALNPDAVELADLIVINALLGHDNEAKAYGLETTLDDDAYLNVRTLFRDQLDVFFKNPHNEVKTLLQMAGPMQHWGIVSFCKLMEVILNDLHKHVSADDMGKLLYWCATYIDGANTANLKISFQERLLAPLTWRAMQAPLVRSRAAVDIAFYVIDQLVIKPEIPEFSCIATEQAWYILYQAAQTAEISGFDHFSDVRTYALEKVTEINERIAGVRERLTAEKEARDEAIAKTVAAKGDALEAPDEASYNEIGADGSESDIDDMPPLVTAGGASTAGTDGDVAAETPVVAGETSTETTTNTMDCFDDID